LQTFFKSIGLPPAAAAPPPLPATILLSPPAPMPPAAAAPPPLPAATLLPPLVPALPPLLEPAKAKTLRRVQVIFSDLLLFVVHFDFGHFAQIPIAVYQAFEMAAKNNTDNCLETLGILYGKMANNVTHGDFFMITHVRRYICCRIVSCFIILVYFAQCILPKQTVTSSSCVELDMQLSDALLDIVGFVCFMLILQLNTCFPPHILSCSEGCQQLGWIHVHPIHDLFLSSVDLHNQFKGQKELPEYIALELSFLQGKKRMGAFSMTDRGMQTIAACHDSGEQLHIHSEGGLYVLNPSFVILDLFASLTLIDTRGNSVPFNSNSICDDVFLLSFCFFAVPTKHAFCDRNSTSARRSKKELEELKQVCFFHIRSIG
jgi:hypothetical protein